MEKAPRSAFPAVLNELDEFPEDAEHSSVSVTHESGWCLSAARGGYVIFENLDEGEPRHMLGLSSEKTLSIRWRVRDCSRI